MRVKITTALRDAPLPSLAPRSLPLDRCKDVCDVICTPKERHVVRRCESADSKYSGNRTPLLG